VPWNESITFKSDFVFNDIRVKKYLVKHFKIKGGSSSYTYLGQLKTTRNICNNFNMLSVLKKNHRYSTYIFILLGEGFCSPCYFHGRTFVRPVMGGLLSALLLSREGFCPPCHFHGRANLSALSFFDGRAFVREGFCLFPIYQWPLSWGQF
jgi:hypothetical protein